MRIAIDARAINEFGTGISAYTYNLIKNLIEVDKKNEYLIFVCNDIALEAIPENFSIRRVSVSIENHPIGDIWENLYLPIKLIRENIDIFHAPAFLIPYIKLGFKNIVTIHDLIAFKYPSMFPSKFGYYIRLLMKIAVKRGDMIISPSINTKKDIMEIFDIPAERIAVIYDGVDNRFLPIRDIDLINNFKNRYNLPEKFILYVGTIEPRKNLVSLIKAFDILKKKIDHKLVIAGKLGWLYKNIFKIIDDLRLNNDIIFTGYVSKDEFPLLYNSGDIFVYPSLYEGFGLPVVEAMASGIPVVASNRSSIPEITGNGALLFDPEDIDDIASSILKVIENVGLKEELKERGLKRAELFNWKESTKETISLYERLLI